MPFQPGQSGNPSGRAPGSVNRKWANVGYWFNIIESNLEDDSIKAGDKIRIAQWAMEILIGKMASITTPEESKENAAEALKILERLENKPRP